MPFLPLSQDLVAAGPFRNVQLVATDMDGTLTRQGKFTSDLLHALEHLARADISVLIVTGRSAGWVQGVASYLPVVGAIAENGGLVYFKDVEESLVNLPDLSTHRQKLAHLFAHLQAEFPTLQESSDNRFRLTDWTFDVEGLTQTDLQRMSQFCQDHGFGFTYSTVQCHIKPLAQSKAIALTEVVKRHFSHLQPSQLVTVGDSPNDESLFDGDRFPLSVGVANVLHYADQLAHHPTYVTSTPEVEGFCELAQLLLKTRSTGTQDPQ